MISSRHRLLAARGILGTALFLVVVMQFLSVGREEKFGGIWKYVWEALQNAFSGRVHTMDLIACAVLIFIHLFTAVQPFLAGFYMRARPILWIVRFMTVAPWVWFFAEVGFHEITAAFRYGPPPAAVLCFFWIMVLLPLGLFVIPPQPEENELVPAGPSQEEMAGD